jgi:hypothetical protein
MRTSELLTAIATWLESPNNEALCLAQDNDNCAQIVAETCQLAALLLKTAAAEVDTLEPPEPSKITPESVSELAHLAGVFDASGDFELKKQASVIDELLLSIAAPPNAYAMRQDLLDQRLVDLKKRYEDPRKELHHDNLIGQSEKAIEKSQMTKRMDIHEQPLLTRTCPDHPGAQFGRVGQNMWQCELDKKVYNFETGYTLENGEKVPGGSVDLQTQNVSVPMHSIFDTRVGRLGYNS